jgi:hypothetical protein
VSSTEITWEKLESYKLIINHFDSNASIDGAMFETYGAELDYVKSIARVSPERVWTYLDCDDAIVFANGFRFVNCIGYLVTELDGKDGEEVIEPYDEDEELDS